MRLLRRTTTSTSFFRGVRRTLPVAIVTAFVASTPSCSSRGNEPRGSLHSRHQRQAEGMNAVGSSPGASVFQPSEPSNAPEPLIAGTGPMDVFPIPQPNQIYLDRTSRFELAGPDGTIVNSLADTDCTVTFSPPTVLSSVPDTWQTWASPPDTESPTPRVLWSQGSTQLTMTISPPSCSLGTFGFEAEPNPFDVRAMTARFFAGEQEVGSVTRNVDGFAGARLFSAAAARAPFTRVVFSSSTDFAIAQLRRPQCPLDRAIDPTTVFPLQRDDRFGMNPGTLSDPANVDVAIRHLARLGSGWVRLEIVVNAKDPVDAQVSYWHSVAQRLRDPPNNLNVLGVVSNASRIGPPVDPTATMIDPTRCLIDPDVVTGCTTTSPRAPSPQGLAYVSQSVNDFTPFVDGLSDLISSWEIWNEADAPATYICPENYAAMMTMAARRWGSVSIAPSIMSLGASSCAERYLDIVLNDTTAVQEWRAEESGRDIPWQFVADHPYPGGLMPDQYLADRLTSLQQMGRPVWVTEIGWEAAASDPDRQAQFLEAVFPFALQRGVPVVFWFALADCVPTFGLLDRCLPQGCPRPAYWSYERMAHGG